MRIAHFQAFAEYRLFVITDRSDYMIDEPCFTEDSCRRGYLVHRPNIVYHNIWNEHWEFTLSIDLCDSAPSEFEDAERVIHLPIILSASMMLHGSSDWQESSFRKLPIGPGRYSLFSKAWNLGAEASSQNKESLNDANFLDRPDVERYEWIICPMVDDVPRVLRGREFLY
jgi:hypothetical protein